MAPFPILFFIFVEVPSMGAMLAHKGIMLATGNETRPLNVWLYRLIGIVSLVVLLGLSFAIGADAACLLFVLLVGGGLAAFVTRRRNDAAPDTTRYDPPPQQQAAAPDALARMVECVQRYEQTKDLADLDRTITEGRALVRAEKDIEVWRRLSVLLGQALLKRHLATNDRGALVEAVEVLRSAGQNIPPGHRLRPAALIELGAALRELGNLSGRLELLDEAAHWYGLCSAIESPKRAQAYVGLSTSLKVKGDKLDDAGVLAQAVAPARYAVGSAPDQQQRGENLTYLSGLLVLLHRRTGDPAAVREAVTAAEEALELSSDPQDRAVREQALRVAQAQERHRE